MSVECCQIQDVVDLWLFQVHLNRGHRFSASRLVPRESSRELSFESSHHRSHDKRHRFRNFMSLFCVWLVAGPSMQLFPPS